MNEQSDKKKGPSRQLHVQNSKLTIGTLEQGMKYVQS